MDSITLSYQDDASMQLTGVQLQTNTQRTSALFGQANDTPRQIQAPPGFKIVGFNGNAWPASSVGAVRRKKGLAGPRSRSGRFRPCQSG